LAPGRNDFRAAGAGAAATVRPNVAGRRRRAGFTLLEILLVLAVIGLITSVLLVGGSRMLRDRPMTADEVFWRAVSEARRFALLHQTEVHLTFDRERRQFHARIPSGSETFPVPGKAELQIDFLSPTKGGRSILIGGTLLETQVLPSITFYDDGTCTPFRVQLRTDQEAPRVIAVDPWTCAPMLELEENR
jgi:prepilin-type N-terminal cleavage/methylation domain-containing protein